MVLGVYPAATEVKRVVVGGTAMMLPMAVEEKSFAPASKSGKEIDDNYLAPLGLSRRDVIITDMTPYFLGNTTKNSSKRSMADNLELFEQWKSVRTGIERRPDASKLVQIARTMPGNLERLAEYMRRCSPRLLFTLGTEAAAFARGEEYSVTAARVHAIFYTDPVRLEVAGHEVLAVHLVHPHLFIKKNAWWIKQHQTWCRHPGRGIVEHAINGSSG
jgi:hypothetical protein